MTPDPGTYEGVLARHPVANLPALLQRHAKGNTDLSPRVMAEARIEGAGRLLALNEIFVGHRSHQSARYVLEFGGETEFQSSSGMIFATGTGMTGWAKSILTATHERLTLDPATAAAAFLVREPWPSMHFGANLRSGLVQDGDSVQLSSCINDGGLVFADGIERDFLHFDWGTELRLGVAPERLNLVV